jgi:benzil reductase ((S)-benzoin forming)
MDTTLTIVTGGSVGLGRALLASAPPGHRVDVSRTGPPPEADEHVAADLADPASWAEVVARTAAIVARGGHERIVFVHNAGVLEPIGFAGEVESGAYTRNVLLNSAAPQVLGHGFLAAVSDLPARRELVLISSGAARTAYAGLSSYGAGKAAADQWVRTVGAEQQDRGGVRVLAVAPGVLATGMQEQMRAIDPRDLPTTVRSRQLHAEGGLVAPEDAATRLWRLLDDPTVATGTVIDLRDT